MINKKLKKVMFYREVVKVLERIHEDIDEINTYEDKDSYVTDNFQMILRNGEPDDNSLDTSYHYSMLKELENDPDFYSKLEFVLSKYIW